MLVREAFPNLQNEETDIQRKMENLRRVIKSSLAEGNFDIVISASQEYLTYDDKSELAHISMFLAKHGVKEIKELSKIKAPFELGEDYKRLTKYISKENKEAFERVIKARGRGKRIAITILSVFLIGVIIACAICVGAKYF